MNKASMDAAAALQLPDEAYYADSSQAFDKITQALAPIDPPATEANASPGDPPAVFALGLPGVVRTERVATLPAALALRHTALREWNVDLRQNLCVIVVDLRSGALHTAAPFKPTKRLSRPPTPSRTGAPPSGLQARITMRGVERFSLPPLFGEEWPSSAFAVTAVSYDWVSNTKLIERRPAPPSVPSVSTTVSSFLEPAAGAMSAAAPGLSLSLPASASPGSPIRVSASVSADAASVSIADEAPQGPRKLMVAHLLLLRLDSPQPVVVSLGVPVALSQGRVSGSFAFDLAKRPEALDLSGEYQAYLVSGRTVTGPQVLTVGRR